MRVPCAVYGLTFRMLDIDAAIPYIYSVNIYTTKPAHGGHTVDKRTDRNGKARGTFQAAERNGRNDGRTAAEVADAIYRMRQASIAQGFGYGLAWNTAAAQ